MGEEKFVKSKIDLKMKILIRLPNWLGDIVMSIAFLEAVKKVYPGCKIYVIVKKGLQDILQCTEGIAEIFEFSKAEFPGLGGAYQFGKMIGEKHNYDLFFCLPNSFSSAWMGFFTGSRKRIGYKKEWRSFLLSHSYSMPKGEHRVEDYVRLLTLFSEAELPSVKVRLNKPLGESKLLPSGKNLLFNINSEAQSRRIPIELAVRLIHEIYQKYNFNIILTGSPKEVAYTSRLVNKLGAEIPVFNFTGKTSLSELIQIVSGVDVIVSTDSGIAHLGNAFSVKTVVLFGAGDERSTRPYNSENLQIIRKPGLACAPCVSNTCKYQHTNCLRELDVDLILKGLEQLIPKSSH